MAGGAREVGAPVCLFVCCAALPLRHLNGLEAATSSLRSAHGTPTDQATAPTFQPLLISCAHRTTDYL